MTDKPLTKAQLATLEGVYHKGDFHHQRTDETPDGKPWFKRALGNSVWRMVKRMQDQGYLDDRNKITAKGYEALHNSPAAMKFIIEEALLQRWKARQQEELDARIAAEEARRNRVEIRRIAEETSRRERLAKLRELFAERRIETFALEDDMLAFAARVHEIMEVY